MLLEQSAGRLLDGVGVGLDATSDDDLALPEGGLDHHSASITGDRVGREGDPGRLRRDHGLHDHGDRGFTLEVVGGSVREDPLAEQRRPRLDDGLEQLLEATHIGERLVHAGERCARRVLRRG